MFQHAFQSGNHVEVFDAKISKEKDKDFDKLFKISNPAGVTKIFDKFTKGYIYELEDAPKTKMHFPKNDKQELGLVQHYLVFQIFLPVGMPFSLEIVVMDTTKNKRRLNFTTSVKNIDKTYFHAKIPVDAIRRGVWLNLSIDLISFFDLFKGQTFRSIDSFILGAACKLRKIFTMKNPLAEFSSDDEFAAPLSESQLVPKNLNFPPGMGFSNQLITLDMVQKHCQQFYEMKESQGLDDSFSKNTGSTFTQALKVRGLLSGTKESKATNDTHTRIHTKQEDRKNLKTQQIPPKNNTMTLEHEKKPGMRHNERIHSALQVRGIPKKNNLVNHEAEYEPSAVDKSAEQIHPKTFESPLKCYDDSALNTSPKLLVNSQRRTLSIDQRNKNVGSRYKKSPHKADTEEEEEKGSRLNPRKNRDLSATKSKDRSEERLSKLPSESKLHEKKVLMTQKDGKEAKTAGLIQGKSPESKRILSATSKLGNNESKQTGHGNNPWGYHAYGKSSSKANIQQVSPRPITQSPQITTNNGKVDSKKGSQHHGSNNLQKNKVSNSTHLNQKDNLKFSKEFEKSPFAESSERFNTTSNLSNLRHENTNRGDFGFLDSCHIVDEIESIEENLEYEIASNASGMNASKGFSDYKERHHNRDPQNLVNILENKALLEPSYNGSKKAPVSSNNKTESSSTKVTNASQHEDFGHTKVTNINDIFTNRGEDIEDSLENPFSHKQNMGKNTDEEKKKINALEDQMTNMSKLRPYSPPYSFGQDNNNNNRATIITKKNNEVIVIGKENSRDTKGAQENKDDEMLEVVYDPVWNCYYHPKTNTYYEMKDCLKPSENPIYKSKKEVLFV